MHRIAHVSSVHSRYDTRILFNQCSSLSCSFDTTFFVCDGKADEVINNVKIQNCFNYETRLARILASIFTLIFHVWKKDIKIYHLHDPELFFLAILLKGLGKKVIFDVHEDYYVDIKGKSWLTPKTGKLISSIYKLIFSYVFHICDAVITVTEKIQFKINCNSKLIKNYPKPSRFQSKTGVKKKFSAIYVGSISIQRGIQSILNLNNKLELPIAIAGRFADQKSEKLVFEQAETGKVVYLGFVRPDEVPEAMRTASLGVHLVSSNENLLSGLPLKIFEYIAAGLPVICSKSSTWEAFFKDFNTVFFVDPHSMEELDRALELCKTVTSDMLLNSQLLLHKKYSWESQYQHLFDIYDQLCSN